MVYHETMNTNQIRDSLPTEIEGIKSDNTDHNMRPNHDPKEKIALH